LNTRVYYSNGNREEVLAVLPGKKIIDVGGATSFADKFVSVVVDRGPAVYKTDKTFIGDINFIEIWQEVLGYVDKFGKFDFCICTHTLEDLYNPILVYSILGKIANEGFVAVPSKYMELSKWGTRGFIHHHWVYNIEGGLVVAYPKICFLEDSRFDDIQKKNCSEVNIWWKDSLEISTINGGYLGPTVEVVQEMYLKGLHSD